MPKSLNLTIAAASLVFACAVTAPTASVAREAAEASRIVVRMVPGITASNQLPTPRLVAARKALTGGQDIRTSDLRQLADLGDGFAAIRFAKYLETEASDVNPADIAHYYGVAAATGRNGAITGLVRALDNVSPADLSASRRATLKEIILTYARAGNSHAIDAIMRYDTKGTPFVAMTSELERLLQSAEGEGAAVLALQLARKILQQPVRSDADMDRAEQHLQTALTSSSLETRLVAQNLLPILTQARTEVVEAPAVIPNEIPIMTPTDIPIETATATEAPERISVENLAKALEQKLAETAPANGAAATEVTR